MSTSPPKAAAAPTPVKPRQRQAPPSLLACIACRKKHLKCDAQMPVCSRCENKSIECVWTQSRRGYKGPRRSTQPIPETVETLPPNSSSDLHPPYGVPETSVTSAYSARGPDVHTHQHPFAPHLADAALTVPALSGSIPQPEPNNVSSQVSTGSVAEFHAYHSAVAFPGQGEAGLYTFSESSGSFSNSPGYLGGSTTSTSTSTSNSGDTASSVYSAHKLGDPLIDAFYTCSYPAHPFVIPPQYYGRDPSAVPNHLQNVFRFVGSHFVPGACPGSLRFAALATISDAVPDDGYKVQSLLLLSMALFARFEQPQGFEALQTAINLALRLGMNHSTYGSFNGQGNEVLEESWRRTWWNLYTVDGLVTAIDGLGWTSILRDVPSDVPLPCECNDYLECRPSLSNKTLFDLQNRIFAEDNHHWSSFAYEVEAVRIMHNVLQARTPDQRFNDADVEALDASLSGFQFALPASKRDFAERDGKIDEVLFAAHMIVHWAIILLHRPRSSLTSLGNPYETVCSNGDFPTAPILSRATHTSKAIRAANEISKMTSIRVPLSVHTPCFTCAMSKAAMVHLPAYTLETSLVAARTIKERLQLAISALTTMGEAWPMAKMVKVQVSQYAREVLTIPRTPASEALMGFSIQQNELTAFNDDSWVDLLGRFEPIGTPNIGYDNMQTFNMEAGIS
jgi:Fungal Zn(2)-Cys(6) binuclear cluster domain/Fungal specific transcription factor domain